jgi:hypothetical protein
MRNFIGYARWIGFSGNPQILHNEKEKVTLEYVK